MYWKAKRQPQQQGTLPLFGLGKIWEVIKTFVKVAWRVFGIVRKAQLVYDFGKNAYELSQLRIPRIS